MSILAKVKASMSNNASDLQKYANSVANNNVYVNNAIGDNNQFKVDFDQLTKDLEEYQKQVAQATTSGVITTTTGLSAQLGLPPGGLAQAVGQLKFPPPLTQQEEQELNELERELMVTSKTAKLNLFKALPREFRQSVINTLLWQEAIEEMNRTIAPQSDRLIDLRNRKANSPFGMPFFGGGFSYPTGMGHAHSHSGLYPQPMTPTVLPDGITKEDLLQAHMDASLEEEIQSGQEEQLDAGSEHSDVQEEIIV